ncbi:fungal zn(2)-Cys(6) binuclear cluster domain-containing protein [Sarocladium implicatum]|nr:fungal zn(2)-Cys(6) binuclear cluster domain-containing protein [Sarocladium implicatum]
MGNNARATRACDGCRFRKVKCNGGDPCSQCAHLALKCTTSSVPRKRTVGARGRLVEQLRQSGTGKPPAPLSSSTQQAHHGALAADGPSPYGGSITSETATSPKTPVPGISPYSHDFFTRLLPDFEEVVYPVNPIITSEEIRAAIENMHNSFEDAALVYAYGAVTINLSKTSREIHRTLADLMAMSLEAHRKADVGNVRGGGILADLTVSVKRVATCVYLEICFMAYKVYNRQFGILREAISMVQTMQVHAKSFGQFSPDPRENARRCRMYWELFIHERFFTIAAGYPSVLQPLPCGLPTGDDSIPFHVESGFNRIISLFCVLDARFLELWTAQSFAMPVSPVTPDWIEAKQSELDKDEVETEALQEKMAAEGLKSLNELQLADLFVTRLWMRTLVWQIALSSGLLRSDPTEAGHEGLSFHFPARRLSAQLRRLVTRLGSVASIGTHGSGILEKLFEITSTIADVLALPTAQSRTQYEDRSPMEDFVFLVEFLLGFERINAQQKVYIQEKTQALREQWGISASS